MKLAYGSVIIAALVASLFAHPCHAQAPVNLAAFRERMQVGIGFRSEWLTNVGSESATPARQWVAVVPVSYNLTKSLDLVGSVAYQFGSRSTRLALGVNAVIFGK